MHDPEEGKVIRQTVPKIIGAHDNLHVELAVLNVQIDEHSARIVVADVSMFLGVQSHHGLFGFRIVAQATDCVIKLRIAVSVFIMEKQEPVVAVYGFSIVRALVPKLAHSDGVAQLKRAACVKIQFLLKVFLRREPSEAIR